MKNYIRMLRRKKYTLCLLIVISLGLFGCGYMNYAVSVDKRILFNEKENSQGNFSDGDLTINYNYKLTGKNLYLAGDASYRGSVDSLDIRILFLDSTGFVLQQKIIYSSGYRVFIDWQADRNFRTNLVVPPGATGISFSFSALPRINQR